MDLDESAVKNGELLSDFYVNHASVKYIRLQWVDFSGVQHAQMVTKRISIMLSTGLIDPFTVAQNCMIIPISTAPQSFPKRPEAWELHPDWTSIKLCGFAIKHASVMCFMHQRGASSPFARCPRMFLHSTVKDFEQRHSTALLVGFEAEFVLMDESLNPPFTPLDPVPGDSTMAGLRGTTLQLMEEIVDAVELAGMHVHKFHTEGVEHFEIALAPMTPMKAVDSLMNLHETIRTIAIRHGLKATLTPRPTLNGNRSGCHVHISIDRASDADSFLAGVMRKVEALCAVGMPSIDSYARVDVDAAGLWIGWGTENRDLPIRKISKSHWELRFVDATANLYLFLALVLAAGSNGISSHQRLDWKDLTSFPQNISTKDLSTYGVLKRMPQNLRASVDVLLLDQDVKRWMGEEMHTQYISIKEVEIVTFSKMSDEQRRRKYLRFF